MDFDFFLWPMLIPMLIPFFYRLFYKKDSCKYIRLIALSMVLIVILYWPLLTSNFLGEYTYICVKFLLFVLLPILLLQVVEEKKSKINFSLYGIKKKNLKESAKFFILFIPVMIMVTLIIQIINGTNTEFNISHATLMFFEAFNEEFFFRGILFVFLLRKTNLIVAYLTSLASFVLMHPQNLSKIFIFGTIVQGILTIEICRRTDNLFGAWLLHGANRFFALAILPFILLI